jgi:formate hydrogenlyase subunit 3/multisubunit Na+/H+ antiporter MnhD subunit
MVIMNYKEMIDTVSATIEENSTAIIITVIMWFCIVIYCLIKMRHKGDTGKMPHTLLFFLFLLLFALVAAIYPRIGIILIVLIYVINILFKLFKDK